MGSKQVVQRKKTDDCFLSPCPGLGNFIRGSLGYAVGYDLTLLRSFNISPNFNYLAQL